MYACICAAVTESAVTEVIRCGAHTREAISAATGAGTGCGSCHQRLCDMIRELTDDRSSAAVPAT